MSLTYWQHSTVPEAFKDKKLALSMRKMGGWLIFSIMKTLQK